jgi:hypothetical protein
MQRSATTPIATRGQRPDGYHRNMRSTFRFASCVLVCAAAALAGCGGGSSKNDNKSTTVGQELQDLEEARNKGLLTEDDYQRQREAILERR